MAEIIKFEVGSTYERFGKKHTIVRRTAKCVFTEDGVKHLVKTVHRDHDSDVMVEYCSDRLPKYSFSATNKID